MQAKRLGRSGPRAHSLRITITKRFAGITTGINTCRKLQNLHKREVTLVPTCQQSSLPKKNSLTFLLTVK